LLNALHEDRRLAALVSDRRHIVKSRLGDFRCPAARSGSAALVVFVRLSAAPIDACPPR
jgi:hypothetical protein